MRYLLPAQGRAALGTITGHFYTPPPDSPTNRRFVADFELRFGGKTPDGFVCQGCDTAEVIVRALKAVIGNTQDKERLVAALEKVEFGSPRGRFRFYPPGSTTLFSPSSTSARCARWEAASTMCRSTKVADVRDPGTGCALPA